MDADEILIDFQFLVSFSLTSQNNIVNDNVTFDKKLCLNRKIVY